VGELGSWFVDYGNANAVNGRFRYLVARHWNSGLALVGGKDPKLNMVYLPRSIDLGVFKDKEVGGSAIRTWFRELVASRPFTTS